MGAGKRGNSSRYGNSGGSTGIDAARNVGIVLGLGGLSFFLGFFVLSRMVPDRHEAGVSSTATLASSQSVTPAPQVAQNTASPARSAPTEPTPAAVPVAPARKTASSDVTIEPADDTAAQKPASVDKTADKNSGDAADKMDKLDAAPDATLDTPPKTGDEGEGEPRAKRAGGTTVKAPSHPPDDGDTPAPPTRRTHRTRAHSATNDVAATGASSDSADNGGIVEGDQKPSRIDRDQSDAQPAETRAVRRKAKSEPKADAGDTTDESAARPVRAVKRSRYRVGAGSYALRESAERAVGRVTDLGLEATVVPVTKEDGTTVYRVQQGVYRSRANAESARQKLSDAGLDAEVVKTGG